MTDEIWKDIQDWPFHQVSNLGRVRVLPGGKVNNHTVTEIGLRKQSPDSYGYMQVHRCIHGSKRAILVHHLVLLAFHEPRKAGQQSRHLNGKQFDNRSDNLKWGTWKENHEDKVRHGTDCSGERNGRAKLTESQILVIRNQCGPRGIVNKLAKEYGVNRFTIRRIRSGVLWRKGIA